MAMQRATLFDMLRAEGVKADESLARDAMPLLPRDFCKPGSSNGRRPLSLTAAASLPLARDCELTYLIDMAEIQPLGRLGPTVDAPPLGPGP